ncbi:hypothetical protein NDA13_004531 [Ustilago tritici]|nr:hypothetical protein NDA13_004531 [Ustilago tritici]
MPKIYKPGKVAVVLSGRHAGKKCWMSGIGILVVVGFDINGRRSRTRVIRNTFIHVISITDICAPIPSLLSHHQQVVVIKQFDDGSKEKSFPYIVAAGIERYPQKVTKRMGAKKIAKRSKVKPFVKIISYNHLMPTRYALELEGLKGAVTQDTFKEPSQREDAKKQIKAIFEEKYTSGKNKWFFTPLRF